MALSSASGGRRSAVMGAPPIEKPKLCDCDACTHRRFALLATVEAEPANKLVCDALPEQNAPSTTNLQ